MGKRYQLEKGNNFIFIYKKRRHFFSILQIIVGLLMLILPTSPFLLDDKEPTNHQMTLISFVIIPLFLLYMISVLYIYYKDKDYKLSKENDSILINNRYYNPDVFEAIRVTEIPGNSSHIYQISLITKKDKITLIHYSDKNDAKEIAAHLKQIVHIPIEEAEFTFYFPWRW